MQDKPVDHFVDLTFLCFSFPACFSAEVAQLVYVYEGGVPLEHVISCVPGVRIVLSNTGVKKICWAENKPPGSPGKTSYFFIVVENGF